MAITMILMIITSTMSRATTITNITFRRKMIAIKAITKDSYDNHIIFIYDYSYDHNYDINNNCCSSDSIIINNNSLLNY